MSYQSVVLADLPKVFLTLNNTSGNFTDISGNAVDFTPHGTITRGVATGHAGLGTGITFGGAITDYLSHVAFASFFDNIITWECWVKWTASGGNQVLAAAGIDDGSHVGYTYYLTSSDTSQNVDGIGAGSRHDPGPPADGLWHYIAMSNASSAWTICVDGALIGDNQSPSVTPVTQPYTIGAWSNAGSIILPFNGSMSNIALYPNALSGGQMQAHYAARDSAPPPAQPQVILPGSVSAALRV